MAEITWEDLQPVLAVHQGAEALRRAVDGAGPPPHLLSVIARYIQFNSAFGPGLANLAGEIAARQGLFQDKEEPVHILADRAAEVAADFFYAAVDEFDDRATPWRDTHRTLAQATLKGMGTFYGYTPVQLNDVLHVNPATEDAIDLVWEGYGVGASLEEARLFRAMGFHTGSEILADQEFVVLDRALRASRADLVAALEKMKVPILGERHNAYYWIRIHTGVEAEHFDAALKGVNNALRFYAGRDSTATVKGWILEGFRTFADVQAEFMARLGEPLKVLRLVAAAAVLFSIAAALYSAWAQGETYDEPDHIAYARRLVETGETERLSVLHYNSKTPGSVPNAIARQAARRWLGVRGPERLRFYSRLPTVATLALLLLLVFVVGRRFLGEAAACLATTACALDPNLIANSAVATVDTLYALATLLTLGAVLWMVERPSVGRGAAVGAALGLAFAVKFSAVLLVPAAALFPWLIPPMRARLRTWRVAVGALAAVFAMLAVIGAAYRFHEIGAELNDIGWRSPAMLRLHALVPHLRLPVPADFMTGFDVLAVAVDKDYPVVLLGRPHPRGVWYYFLVVWVLKEPVLLLAAQVFGLARTVATRALWTDPTLAYLALSLALNLAYFSFFFATQVGFRFVLMCLPIAALIAGAGLAPLAMTARGRVGIVVVALSALAENVPYLGNHLAFTNAAVWPKREAFRLLTNANIDWGQNDEKIAGWLAERGLAGAAFNPHHARPGENVFGLNFLAGVGRFRQHLWLREHASPRAHLGHTYLWFTVDAATYERLIEETRHLRPSAVDARLCAGAEPAGPLVDGGAASLPDLGRTEALILCVTTDARIDLGLIADAGSVVLGPLGEPLRTTPGLSPGQQSWYRLEPGTSALAAFSSSGLRARWAVRGGTATLATRVVLVERGLIAEDPVSPP